MWFSLRPRPDRACNHLCRRSINVRKIERAQDFFGLSDTSWACVALRKTIVPECHVIIEAFVGPFVFFLHLHSPKCYIQAGILAFHPSYNFVTASFSSCAILAFSLAAPL